MSGIEISREKIVIPTYELEPPEAIPVFYEMRNHQGTKGSIYPYPMIDTFKNKKTSAEYDSIRLENDYIRVRVLPELGGRIYEGYNKKLDYNFVYKNNVIKPAMIGLCGAWLSGGLEFNWPTHHRPTTFMKVDAKAEENSDGSKTVWVGETEGIYGLRCSTGITIWPDRAYFKVSTRVYNPTLVIQTFHWWANLAVHTNENYQIKFPPDIDYITFHGKAFVNEFPIVKGLFGAFDFGKDGRDVTWYKNNTAGASYFIFNSNYNFMGGYDHGRKAGVVHIADRHISPGKKFFTWGNDVFGLSWQKNLTDSDGPYLEIMTGCYTDNQPDFCFINPDETKTFEQVWYALDNLPDLKNANEEGAVSLSVDNGKIVYGFNSTRPLKNARAVIGRNGKLLSEQIIDIEPGKPFNSGLEKEGSCSIKDDIQASLYDNSGALIVEYKWRPSYFDGKDAPKPHEPARRPEDIPTIEEVFLEGLHIEQYHHPLLNPSTWYLEGIKRDPLDSRCNNAIGRLELKRCAYEEALSCFEKAVKRQTMRNFNPLDGEALFNLGTALYRRGKYEEALINLRKAAWSLCWKAPALKLCAVILSRQEKYPEAFKCAEEAFPLNSQSAGLRLIMCAALRKSGNSPRAAILAKETLSFDPLDLGARFELAFAEGSEYPAKEQIEEITGGRPSSLLELAGSYLEAGFAGEALKVLSFCGNLALPHIYMAFALDMNGDGKAAADELEKAESAPPDLVFPGKDREIEILSFSVSRYREGALAPYYLGCLYYGRGNHNAAIPLWEEAVRRKPDYYHALRCLGIAYYEIGNDPVSSLQAMEKAFRLCKKPRYFLELLQLYKVCRKSVAERLETAEKNTQLLEMRDDLYKEYITLLNLNGRYAEAIQKLKSHIFHPYEGGEGILIREHVLSYIALGLKELAGGNFGAAVKYLKDALRYPENYGEGRKYNAHEAHIHYHLGLAYEKSGDMAAAKEWYLKAAGEEDDGEEPGICKSMALRKLGYVFEGLKVCENMLAMAERKLENLDEVPYMGLFPTGLPFEQSYKRLNHISALTAKMYGVIGMGRKEEARLVRGELDKITDISPWVNIINSDMEEFENG